MNITLEAIKTEQTINLNLGEHYAGIILGKYGAQDHHLILISGETEKLEWNDAKEWAAKAGGELPTLREQALLYANLKEQFQGSWYWSGEKRAYHSGYAWCQDFLSGLQDSEALHLHLGARAVRRLVIE